MYESTIDGRNDEWDEVGYRRQYQSRINRAKKMCGRQCVVGMRDILKTGPLTRRRAMNGGLVWLQRNNRGWDDKTVMQRREMRMEMQS